MPLVSFKRPLGGQCGVEVVPHQAGDRVEIFSDRFGSRLSVGFHPDEVVELIAALEEAVGLAGEGQSRARPARLRSYCRRGKL